MSFITILSSREKNPGSFYNLQVLKNNSIRRLKLENYPIYKIHLVNQIQFIILALTALDTCE